MKNYVIGMYEKAVPKELSWEEKFIVAKEAGFDFIELSIDETEDKLRRLDWSVKERKSLQSLMWDIGMPLRSMCLSGHRKYPLGSNDPVVRNRGIEIMRKAVDLAADLGIRIIQLAGYDVYYEEETAQTDRLFRENLKEAVKMAAEQGVMLGFETMETEYMNTVDKAMKFVTEVDSPYLHVYPDSGNIMNAAVTYGTDVYADLRSGKGHIIAMHLKETMPGKFREIPFGTGHVDFEAMIEEAWKLGVRRFVTEMWYTGNENWKKDVRDACLMMTNIIDKYGRTNWRFK